MAVQKTSALVLKSINWKDSSKITTLFTRELGKLNVMAKGARRSGSRYGGILESLNLIEAFIYISPRRELQMLGDISLEHGFSILRRDLSKTGYAFGVLELLDAFFAFSNPDTTFFDFNQQILQSLENSDNEQVVFWYYLLKLASYLGFKPDFSDCRKCGRQVNSEEICFSMNEGSVICPSCLPAAREIVKISRADLELLAGIQRTRPAALAGLEISIGPHLNFTDFLLQYIQFHTGQKLNLNGLRLSGFSGRNNLA